MRAVYRLLAAVIVLGGSSSASDRSVTYTVQALSGLVGDTPRFDRVYCHDVFGFSGEPTAFSLICAPNIPPTNSKDKLEDHNLLSAAGIKIAATRANAGISVTLDLSSIKIPRSMYDGSEDELIAISLECIRMTAALCKIDEYSLTIKSTDKLQEVANEYRTKFLKHDRTKPFVIHPAEEPSK